MKKFDRMWCYEMVRLREQGAITTHDHHDSHANQIAIEQANSTELRLLTRAQTQSQVLGLQQAQSQVRMAMRMGLFAVWVVSLLLGISAGLASLGDSSQPVNVVWAIGSLLLLPTIMLLAWLLTFLLRATTGGWFGQGFELLIGKVLNQGKTTDAWRAWLRLALRAKAHRWWLALLTHSIWLWLLTGMILALLVAFSLRHYTFVWQTTWLSPDVFVQFAQAVGALPAKLGFVMPDSAAIKASGNVALDEPVVRLAWANWVVGALLVFGWIPRLLMALVSWGVLRRLYSRCQIDQQEAYALQIRQRLERLASKSEVDAPPGSVEPWQHIVGIDPGESGSDAAVVVVEAELPSTLHGKLPAQAALLPPVDDRESRQQSLDRLRQLKPARLLVIADARQTPDRGLVKAIVMFGSQAVQTRVFLLHLDDERARRTAWTKRLDSLGLAMPVSDPSVLVQWLRSGE